jgi:cysteine desulfurase/selenocysteine lyase
MGGGDMIKTVSFKGTTYAEIPFKYEAGTPNIEGAIGLGVALNYMNDIGLDKIYAYENSLLQYATEQLQALGDIHFYGTAQHKASVISFIPKGTHPYVVGVLLDKMGVAVRTGHHCTQPIMERFEIPGTVRASFAFYNTVEEIDIFIEALKKACSMLR